MAAVRRAEPGAGAGAGGGCGFKINRKAKAGQKIGANEYAATTYVARAHSPLILGVVAPPAVAYWGPGDTIPAKLPLIGNVGDWVFAGGVIFRNC